MCYTKILKRTYIRWSNPVPASIKIFGEVVSMIQKQLVCEPEFTAIFPSLESIAKKIVEHELVVERIAECWIEQIISASP